MKGSMEILDGGLLTTVQDEGRKGYRKYGIPLSGVMDTHGYRLANWLVGNPDHAPVLECTLKGPSIKFNTSALVGVAGAEADLTINGIAVERHQSLQVEPGDVLRVGNIYNGCRICLSVRGNWDLEKIMDSYSTCLAASFGGFEGRPLKKGDSLSWEENEADQQVRQIRKELLPYYANRQEIRIIEGPEWNWLNEEQKEQFLISEYAISPQSNRMGIRLNGKAVIKIKEESMSSAPVPMGTIQLPPSGHPIILMNDAQSVGGYPRVAKVIDADLWRLGQVWAPVKIKFNLIELKKALTLSAYRKELI